jgi:hypothetical protein
MLTSDEMVSAVPAGSPFPAPQHKGQKVTAVRRVVRNLTERAIYPAVADYVLPDSPYTLEQDMGCTLRLSDQVQLVDEIVTYQADYSRMFGGQDRVSLAWYALDGERSETVVQAALVVKASQRKIAWYWLKS